jgi:hypothetical protein
LSGNLGEGGEEDAESRRVCYGVVEKTLRAEGIKGIFRLRDISQRKLAEESEVSEEQKIIFTSQLFGGCGGYK